jgi:hypothetical protein
MIGRRFDTAQLGQAPDADEPLVRQFAGFEKDHQIGSAGEGLPSFRHQ